MALMLKPMVRTCLLLLAALLVGQQSAADEMSADLETWEHEGWLHAKAEAMGTRINVTLWHEDKNVALEAVRAVVDEMQRIDRQFSPWIKSSELAQLNAKAATAPVQLSLELYKLIKKSLWFSEISGGAFDITFASVGWHYDYREKRQPDVKQREALLPAVNYRRLQLDPKTRELRYGHPDIRIDLGGIAKGYAVDNAIALVQTFGVEHAMVSAGGDSRVLGDKRGRPWMVGIKHPRPPEEGEVKPIIYLPLADTAVSTSGDYERYFFDERTGKRVHHIINPKTGASAQGVMSVTVLADHGLDADPLSTTVFVLGVEKGLNLVNGLQGVDCVVIDTRGKVHYSAGLMPPDQKKTGE